MAGVFLRSCSRLVYAERTACKCQKMKFVTCPLIPTACLAVSLKPSFLIRDCLFKLGAWSWQALRGVRSLQRYRVSSQQSGKYRLSFWVRRQKLSDAVAKKRAAGQGEVKTEVMQLDSDTLPVGRKVLQTFFFFPSVSKRISDFL